MTLTVNAHRHAKMVYILLTHILQINLQYFIPNFFSELLNDQRANTIVNLTVLYVNIIALFQCRLYNNLIMN